MKQEEYGIPPLSISQKRELFLLMEKVGKIGLGQELKLQKY
jgi:hypothetical protein